MLTKKFARVRKAMAVALSATLFTGVAGAAQGGGCSVNVDEALLQQLTSLLESGNVHGNLHFNGNGGGQDDGVDEPDGDNNDVDDGGDAPDQPV